MPLSSATVLGFLKLCASGVGVVKGVIDDDPSAIAASTVAGFQALLLGALKDFGSDAYKLMLKSNPTDPLEYAIASLTVLECINGFGGPDKGAVLKVAANEFFDGAVLALQLAEPDELRWSGDAANAYGVQIANLKKCVAELQAGDKLLASTIENQALLVVQLRQKYTYTKMGLVASVPIALALYLQVLAASAAAAGFGVDPTRVALLAAYGFQIPVIIAALTELGYFTGVHIDQDVPDNVRACKAKDNYRNAKAAVPLLKGSSPTHQAMPTGGTSNVSAFRSPSGAGNFPAAGSRSYPVAGAKAYPVAAGKGEHGDGVSNEPLQRRPPTMPETEAPDTPATPPAAARPFVPAAASMMQTAGQTIQGAVSQATKALQQSGAPGERATAKESAPGAHVAGADAAAGADGAERAPVDAAAVSSERAQELQAQEPRAQEPRPAHRIQ